MAGRIARMWTMGQFASPVPWRVDSDRACVRASGTGPVRRDHVTQLNCTSSQWRQKLLSTLSQNLFAAFFLYIFCRDEHVAVLKSMGWQTTPPPSGRGQGHVTRFWFFPPLISLESVKLDTSNFVCWLLQRSTRACMMHYSREECVESHVTSSNFGK